MLAPIRGTNQYWFRVKGEVKAMIAEYGLPTLFLTLSGAEYDSADIAQYLRKDFFNIVILQRGVLGKVEQYYVKKEYQMRGAPHYHILLWIRMLQLSVLIVQKKSVLSYKIGLPVIYQKTSTR
uniref:Helitron helicase-like domain-containing protein n=1 Tax=Amphimedon queenslandica TaxID=400682 RepID=A0A1X7UBH0_AMPQE